MARKESKVVLLVEDDPTALSYFQRLLEQEGYIVLCARSAAQAADFLKQVEVSLALVDYRLPDGAGSEVVHAIQQSCPDAQSIIVTGYGTSEAVTKSIDEGVFAFLNKPVESRTLLAYCSRAMNLYRIKRENTSLHLNMQKYADELTLRNLELDAISRITALASAQQVLDSGREGEALDIVLDTLSADSAMLFDLSGRDGEFVLRSHRGLTEGETAALGRLDAFLGLLGRVASRRRIVAAENTNSLPIGYPPQSPEPADTPDLKVLLGCPLASKGKLLGVLVAAYRTLRPIGQAHRILVASLGRQLSIAMENILLSEMVAVDALTSLYTRGYFDHRLAQELCRAKRHGHLVSVCLTDVDQFQALDASYGPFFGERMLQGISGCLRPLLRRSDIAGRYGQGEMGIVLPETGLDGARRVAEKFQQAVEDLKISPEAGGGEGSAEAARFTVSVGVSCFPAPGENPETIVRQANEALSRAKEEGANRVVCYGE